MHRSKSITPSDIETREPRGSKGPRSVSVRLILGVVCLAVAATSPSDAQTWMRKFPYAAGEAVVIQGTVTDANTTALADLEVVLELTDTRLSLRPFGRAPRAIHRVATRTDERGAYSLRVVWDRSWDRAALVVGVPLQRTDGPKVHVLESLEVTRRLAQGSPASIGIVIQEVGFLENHRAFLASLTSESMVRAYREKGRPDRVDSLETPAAKEVSWWYYAAGVTLRFRDGVLVDTQSFEPIAEPK